MDCNLHNDCCVELKWEISRKDDLFHAVERGIYERVL